MKTLTLHQPWALAIAAGWKEVETRGWYTDYRGPLAIHAGRKKDIDGRILWLSLGEKLPDWPEKKPFEELTFGAIVATCQLSACLRTASVEYDAKKLKQWFQPARGWETERRFGNYGMGRWAWILRAVVPVDPPIPAHGWQRLWNWKPPENAAAELGLRP